MLLWFKCVKRKWVKEEMSVYGGLVESSLNLRDVVGGHDSGDSQHIPTILYPNNRLFGQLFFFIIFIYSIKKNNNKKKPDITHDDSQVSHNCCKLSPSVKSGHYTFSPSLRALVPLRRSPTASVYIIIFKSTTTPLACNLFIKSRSRQSRSTYSPPVRAHGLPRDAPHAESKRGKNERSAYLRDPKE